MSEKAIEKTKSVNTKEIRDINWRGFFINTCLIALALVYMFVQSGCVKSPISSNDSLPESDIATNVAQTLESIKAPLEEATFTPIEESTSTVEPMATDEYLDIDFSITPEMWNELFMGKDNYSVVLRSIEENKNRHFQYQVWLEGKETGSRLVGDRAYFTEIEGKSMLMSMNSLEETLKFQQDDLELKIFDKVMESQIFIPREYLDHDINNVNATVVFMKKEGDRYVYRILGEGCAIFVKDGEVEIFKSKEIPSSLSIEVKKLYEQGYTRVDINNGVVEGFGKWEW